MTKVKSEVCLSKKVCIPCNTTTSPLNKKDAQILLLKLKHGWTINIKNHLYKKFDFNNFINAMNYANKIAELSEEEGHHPNLKIAWGVCTIEIWTHKINGLSESDFVLAAKIDEIS